MTTSERRYDIDWLRVITIGLLLIYHIAIIFQPWGIFIQFIQSEQSLEGLWIPMAMLNIWRIPLLFFVSGMGVCFAIRKRDWKQLFAERSKRIFLPFLFGMFFIVPLHVLIWQNYYQQDLNYLPNPSHLWFLSNIFIYVLMLSPVFYYLKKNEDGKIMQWFRKLMKNPLGLLIVIIPFALEAVIMNPEPFEMYAMTWHGFFLGLLAFLFGFCFVLTGSSFWNTILKWRWLLLSIAFGLYLVRLLAFELKTPNYLMSIESNIWIFAVFGFAYKYLNKPSKALSYLSQAAYPIYILHMAFMFLGAVLILPLEMPVFAKFVSVIAFTSIGSFSLYELLIKRIGFLRPLFGLKTTKKAKDVAELSVNY
jgi:glucan biosynthesis protein C